MTHDISYSQINNWLDCGERFRLERLEKIPTPPTWPLVAGKAVHMATERVDIDAWDMGHDDPEITRRWLTTLDDAVNEAADYDETDTGIDNWRTSRDHGYDWWIDNGSRMVSNWVRTRQERKWRLFMDDPIQSIELYVDGWYGDNRIRGYIDRLMMTEDGEPFILDIKTGERPPVFPLQLGIYADLLRRGPLDVDVAGGFYSMVGTPSKGAVTPMLDLSGFTTEIITRYTDALGAALDSNTFLPHPGIFCSTCGVREHCSVGSTLYIPPPAAKKPPLKPITRKETK